jgi:ligand-binding sensor domain-containing protein
VFSPGQMFTGQPVNGQRIVITAEDGNNELLLAQTVINDIAVDGANRKWIATQGAGVILVSEDGREVIHRFRAGETPLFSDNVLCVALDPSTGEVYFGTDLGIVSYRGNATEATDSFGDVYVFPNPVRETHDGPVTVAGLARDSDVIITDVAGNLVYRTQAQGGTATWNGRRYDGRRPATGVYLVFCTNEDGSEAMVTKFLYIH